jgi:hypothetical protein
MARGWRNGGPEPWVVVLSVVVVPEMLVAVEAEIMCWGRELVLDLWCKVV